MFLHKSFALLLLSFVFIFSMGCNRNDDNDSRKSNFGRLLLLSRLSSNSYGESSEAQIENALETGMSSISESTGEINQGSTSVAYIPEKTNFWEDLYYFYQDAASLQEFLLPSVHASTERTCRSGGSVSRTVKSGTDFPGPSASLLVSRSYDNCKFYSITQSGATETLWTGLQSSSPYVISGTVLKQGVERNFIFSRRNISYTISTVGSGDKITGGEKKLAHTLTWSNSSSSSNNYTIETNLKRTGKDSSGNTVFEHNVTTPEKLSVSYDSTNKIRTITSGRKKVEHVLAGFSVEFQFDNFTWDSSSCLPKSGTINFTLSGSKTGSGSITFSDSTISTGSGTYTYNISNGSGNGTINFTGCN